MILEWKNRLILDFLKNRSNDFANFGNLDETNGPLLNGRGPMFWKTLDLEMNETLTG